MHHDETWKICYFWARVVRWSADLNFNLDFYRVMHACIDRALIQMGPGMHETLPSTWATSWYQSGILPLSRPITQRCQQPG